MLIHSATTVPPPSTISGPESSQDATENKDKLPSLTSGGETSANEKDRNNNSNQHDKHNNSPQSERERQQIQKLATRDREVRAHEAAHKAAGGNLTGPASYSYTKGPDGKRYATSGEVSINASEIVGDPQATLRKANQIRAAALAPAQPSSQDQKVAIRAAMMAADARAQMLAEDQKLLGQAEKDDKQELSHDKHNDSPNHFISAYSTLEEESPKSLFSSFV